MRLCIHRFCLGELYSHYSKDFFFLQVYYDAIPEQERLAFLSCHMFRQAGSPAPLHPQSGEEECGEGYAVHSKCRPRSDTSLSCSHFIAQHESRGHIQLQKQWKRDGIAGRKWNSCERMCVFYWICRKIWKNECQWHKRAMKNVKSKW